MIAINRTIGLLFIIAFVLCVISIFHFNVPNPVQRPIHRCVNVELGWSLPSVNLSSLPRIGFSHHRKQFWRNDAQLPRVVAKEEYDVFIRMLTDVDRVLRQYEIVYMMSGGTMLGSYYHHDMIPWDDDADIVVDMCKMDQLHEAVASLGDAYRLHEMGGGRWLKLYRTDGRKIPAYPFKWPYVDVFLFTTEDNNWFEFEIPDVSIPLEDIFPLSLRPFGPLWLPAPRNVPLYLQVTMPMNESSRPCSSRSWDHMNENSLKQFTVPCVDLMDTYPFVVKRRPAPSPWLATETVRIGNVTVQEVLLPGN